MTSIKRTIEQEGEDQPIIKIQKIENENEGIEEKEKGEDIEVKVGAGVSWDKLVSFSTEKGLWGLENLSIIPGSVGGACVQNIGAYGSELKDTLKEVYVFDLENKIHH